VMKQYISETELSQQSWKFYFAAIAWPLYVFIVPFVYAKTGWGISVLFMIFPGAYLYVWMACLMHECWHKYVAVIDNKTFYNLFSYMLFTDPQIYRLVHGNHHSRVNTWEDTEFHPFGKIENSYLRRIFNFFEIALGVIFIFSVHMLILPRHPDYKSRYRASSLIRSVCMWILIYGGLGFCSAVVFRLSVPEVTTALLISFWLGSLLTHHLQLVEHGNLIVKGDFNERQIRSRNLRREGILEKLFLFLVHGDPREHVLHHTSVGVYTRPFPGRVPMPENAAYISLSDYAGVLWGMVRRG